MKTILQTDIYYLSHPKEDEGFLDTENKEYIADVSTFFSTRVAEIADDSPTIETEIEEQDIEDVEEDQPRLGIRSFILTFANEISIEVIGQINHEFSIMVENNPSGLAPEPIVNNE